MQNLEHFLTTIPPIAVYLVVAGIVLLESIGIPLPGETALIAAALMSAHHELDVSPFAVACSGAFGAIVGDSIGYSVGHHFGRRLLGWARQRFPRHFGAREIAYAEHMFEAHGVWAVFFGRFVALLRIFAGPLSGILRLPYHKFLPANALGGIAWAFGATYLVYSLGTAAEGWLKNAAWLALLAFVVVVAAVSLFMRRAMERSMDRFAAEHPEKVAAAEAIGA